MKNFKLYSVLAVLLVAVMAGSATAAPNIFGVSGLLEVPTDVTLSPGAVSLGYHGVVDLDDAMANFFTGEVGLATGLEAGIGFVTADEDIFDGDDNGFLINGKYRFIAETVDRPAVTVGVIDLLEEISDDPSFFLVVSKTLTGAAEEVTGEPSKPLRGHIGFGSGIYDGLFLALDWVLAPKVQVAFEYVNGGLEDTDFNGLLRYSINRDLRLDIGAIDFSDFTFGVSYTSMKF